MATFDFVLRADDNEKEIPEISNDFLNLSINHEFKGTTCTSDHQPHDRV